MSDTPKLDQLLRNGKAEKGRLIMTAFTGLVVGLNAYFTAAFGYESAAVLRTGIWWLDGAVGALYYLALLDGAAIAWHYGQLAGESNKQRTIALWMKRTSAGASVLMSLAYVTLYTALWDASGLVIYAQIMGAVIIYAMTAAQFIAYIMYRDSDPEHVEADAHAAMRAEATNHRLESQATAMTNALEEAGDIMRGYTAALAQQQAHAIVNDLLDMMRYNEHGAADLPQLPPTAVGNATPHTPPNATAAPSPTSPARATDPTAPTPTQPHTAAPSEFATTPTLPIYVWANGANGHGRNGHAAGAGEDNFFDPNGGN